MEASGGEHAHRREKDPLLYRFIEHRIREIELTTNARNAPVNSGDSPNQGSNDLVTGQHSDPYAAPHADSTVNSAAAQCKGGNVWHAAEGAKDKTQSQNCRSSRFGHGFRRRMSVSKHEGEK